MADNIKIDVFTVSIHGGRTVTLKPGDIRGWFAGASQILTRLGDVSLTIVAGPTALTYPAGTEINAGSATANLMAQLYGKHGLPKTSDGTAFQGPNPSGDSSLHLKAFFVPGAAMVVENGRWVKPLVEGKMITPRMIAVDDDVAPDKMPLVIAHEIGHVLIGPGHEPKGTKNFLMSRSIPELGEKLSGNQRQLMQKNARRLAAGTMPDHSVSAYPSQ